VEFSEVYKKCLALRSPQSAVPEKNGARAEALPPFYDTLIVVSVNIVCFPLYINIVLIYLFCYGMCGLPGHTYNECLVFFGKPGMTVAPRKSKNGHVKVLCVDRHIDIARADWTSWPSYSR
jgi:hypothetical protein